MKKNLKIKILVTLLLILTMSLMTTYSNAAIANLNTDFFTNLRTSLSRSLTQAITMGKEMLQKIAEGFDIGLEQTEQGLKLNLSFDYEGKYITVDSGNEGVVEFDMSTMTFKANGNGETTINLNIGDRKIPINVKVSDGNIEFIPQGKGVTVNGGIDANFKIDEKELANIDTEVKAEGSIEDKGVTGKVESTQNISLLEMLKMKFNEKGNASLDSTGISGEFGGDAKVGETSIINGTAGLGYEFGDADPKGSLNGNILGKEISGLNNVTVPIFTGLRLIFSKLIK